jgi:hypothetical protein
LEKKWKSQKGGKGFYNKIKGDLSKSDQRCKTHTFQRTVGGGHFVLSTTECDWSE